MKILLKIISITLCFVLLCFASGCGSAKADLTENPSLADSNYSLGDYMGDYTVTDVNGNSYTFSELLETKKAIVLNFWFINCGPCQMEFPYLQKAYNSYIDDIEIIAINPVDKKASSVEKYAKQNELTIPLAVGEEEWATAFGLKGFPTTVIIDRYGCIAFMHTGAVIEDGVFEKIFDYFTADNYKQTTIKNISDIE